MTSFHDVVGLVVRNKEYQRKRARHMVLRDQAAEALRWYEATDDRAKLIEARRLEREANVVAREMSEIAEALARKIDATTAVA